MICTLGDGLQLTVPPVFQSVSPVHQLLFSCMVKLVHLTFIGVFSSNIPTLPGHLCWKQQKVSNGD